MNDKEVFTSEEAVKVLNKMFGIGTVLCRSKSRKRYLERFSSGSPVLDYLIGGGWPCGRIVQIYGLESSGKSTVCFHAMREAQRVFPDKKVVYIDFEGSWDDIWADKIGIDLDKVYLSEPVNGNEGFDIIEAFIRAEDISLIVVDSVAVMSSRLELDVPMEKEQMAVNPRLINKGLRKVHAALNSKTSEGKENNTTVILVNQIRSSLDQWGSPEILPGGRGVKYSDSIRVRLKKGEMEFEGDMKNLVTFGIDCKVVKNKTSVPFRTGSLYLVVKSRSGFKQGAFDWVREIIRFGTRLGVVESSGSGWFNIKGKSFHGVPALVEALREDIDFVKEVHGKICEELGISLEEVKNGFCFEKEESVKSKKKGIKRAS